MPWFKTKPEGYYRYAKPGGGVARLYEARGYENLGEDTPADLVIVTGRGNAQSAVANRDAAGTKARRAVKPRAAVPELGGQDGGGDDDRPGTRDPAGSGNLHRGEPDPAE